MKFLEILARMVRNSDQSTELMNRLVEALTNQSTAVNERLDKFIEALTDQSTAVNERLDKFIEGRTTQSTAVNERLDKLIEARTNQSSAVNERLDKLLEVPTNLSTALNERLDKIIETPTNESTAVAERLDKLIEAWTNQSIAVSERLDKLIEIPTNQSTAVNKKLDKLIEAWTNQSAAVNKRLDRSIEAYNKLIDNQNRQHYAQRVEVQFIRQFLRIAQKAPFQAHAQRIGRLMNIYICHGGHEHDRIYSENVTEHLTQHGIECMQIEFNEDGLRPELEQCLDGPAAVLGFNSQLDHSWLQSGSFLGAAAHKEIPVIQWILDHPSVRWPEFSNSTPANSRFLLNSDFAKGYFDRYCMPGCMSMTIAGVGPNKRSRISGLSPEEFLRRDITCLIALSLNRAGRSAETTQAEIAVLDTSLARAVGTAVELARFDLIHPLELHLIEALKNYGLAISDQTFNTCFRLVEESVQLFRRRKIFSVARDYPVLIQSDASATPLLTGGRAIRLENISMQLTISRMRSCRAVLSVSYLNDMVHDRTMNGWNAGCANIVEDNLVHRSFLQHGINGLLFRYDDDSLRECLDIVCCQPERAHAIAEAGMVFRDDPRFRFGGFDNILALARQ
jgi:hypothetical protein